MKALFLSLLSLLIIPQFFENNPQNSAFFHENEGYLTLEVKEDSTYKVTGLSDLTLNEYRIYHEYDDNVIVSEIADNIFSSVDHNIVLLISNGITNFTSGAFSNNITQINYTGSEAEWISHNILTSIPVYYYQCDEGFINYWNTNIRPTAEFDVCSIGKDGFMTLKAMYDALGAKDKTYVDAYKDKADTKIGETMNYLSKYFEDNKENSNGANSFLSQDVTLGLIVSIAIFGMTTISIFYLLKKRNIIS